MREKATGTQRSTKKNQREREESGYKTESKTSRKRSNKKKISKKNNWNYSQSEGRWLCYVIKLIFIFIYFFGKTIGFYSSMADSNKESSWSITKRSRRGGRDNKSKFTLKSYWLLSPKLDPAGSRFLPESWKPWTCWIRVLARTINQGFLLGGILGLLRAHEGKILISKNMESLNFFEKTVIRISLQICWVFYERINSGIFWDVKKKREREEENRQ